MSVEPEQSDVFSLPAEAFRNSGNGADGNRVIPAEDQRRPLFLPDFEDHVCKVTARVGDFFEVFCFCVSKVVRFLDDHVEIPEVLHFVSQRLEFFVQICISQGRRSHVHTAPVRSEIHRHTNDRYFLHNPYCRIREGFTYGL